MKFSVHSAALGTKKCAPWTWTIRPLQRSIGASAAKLRNYKGNRLWLVFCADLSQGVLWQLYYRWASKPTDQTAMWTLAAYKLARPIRLLALVNGLLKFSNFENATLPHLVSNVQEFADKVQRIQVEQDDLWIRIDIRDFFLSGQRHDLVPDALRGWRHDGKRALVEDVFFFLLYNPFVKTTTDKDRLWRVTQGSGMGLVHSSDFMDYVSYNKVEAGLLPFLH